MSMSCLHHRKFRQDGYTLIEIMVSIVLVSVLALGMTSLFATVEEEFYALTLRQKAVLLLHGEMERLYGMYQKSGYSIVTGTPTSDDSPASVYFGAETPLHPNVSHRIHSLSLPHSNLTRDVSNNPITTSTFLRKSDNTVNYEHENAVLRYAPPSTPSNIQNIVWLDQEKRLTARLSWTHESQASIGCIDNGATSSCALVTLYLDFPYRYDESASPPNPVASADMGRVETLILRAIMGDR